MPLDINLFRVSKGGNPDLVRKTCEKRFQDPKVVDEVIALDDQFVKAQFDASNCRKEMNQLTKQFPQYKKEGKSTDELTSRINELKDQIVQDDELLGKLETELSAKLHSIGNLIPEDVPVSKNEDDNQVRFQCEEQPPKVNNHIVTFQNFNGTDCVRGTKVAGSRGYFLCGFGAIMNQALIQYAQRFLAQRGYIMMQTPFFLEKEIMQRCAQLSDFDEQLYKVSGEGNEKYLIATSEQSLCSYFSDEVIDFKQFNKGYEQYRKQMGVHYANTQHKGYFEKYAPLTPEEFENSCILFGGYSSCFRKEVGKHGQDTLGIFRIHQFEKVEQLVICKPELSERLHATMISIAMEFYDSLKLPYRVVDIVSGALNDAAARKFDLEAWFPGSQCYRELVSCSNCLDYQSRGLNVKTTDKQYVHMLNSTVTATERTMCCIVENYQRDGYIEVPEVLRQYVGVDKIMYETSQNAKK